MTVSFHCRNISREETEINHISTPGEKPNLWTKLKNEEEIQKKKKKEHGGWNKIKK